MYPITTLHDSSAVHISHSFCFCEFLGMWQYSGEERFSRKLWIQLNSAKYRLAEQLFDQNEKNFCKFCSNLRFCQNLEGQQEINWSRFLDQISRNPNQIDQIPSKFFTAQNYHSHLHCNGKMHNIMFSFICPQKYYFNHKLDEEVCLLVTNSCQLILVRILIVLICQPSQKGLKNNRKGKNIRTKDFNA